VRMSAILISILTKIEKFFKNIYYDFMAAVVAGTFLYFSFAAPARITAPSADDFFSSYFSAATEASQQVTLYDDDVTPSFRKFESWAAYSNLWSAERKATPGPAFPGPSPLEYTVTLTFYPVEGRPFEQTINYYLACGGFFGAILARDPFNGCPPGDIKIDRTQWVNMSAN
jgi:hypothetical protein